MTRIPKRTPDELTESERSLYFAIVSGPRAQGPQLFALTEKDGSLRGPFNAFLLSPKIGAAAQALGVSLRYSAVLNERLRELTILLVAARWNSQFERDSHEAIARHIGFTEDELIGIQEGDFTRLNKSEAVVARLVSSLLDGDLTDEEWVLANNLLSVDEIFELTTLVGYYSMLALQLRVFRV